MAGGGKNTALNGPCVGEGFGVDRARASHEQLLACPVVTNSLPGQEGGGQDGQGGSEDDRETSEHL